MALLSMMVVAMLGMFTIGQRRVYGGKKMTEATVLAQRVMEQLNQPEADELLDAAGTATSATKAFTRQRAVSGTTSTTAAETAADGARFATRNLWRQMFLDADLPYGTGSPNRTELRVTVTPLPSGNDFDNAELLRLEVDVLWAEGGQRAREAHLETINAASE